MDRLPPPSPPASFWNGPLTSTLDRLGATADGLTTTGAASRRARWGPNDPAADRPPPTWRRIAGRFANPLVLMLLAASLIAGATGDVASFLIISTIVILSVAIDFLQEDRARGAIDALRRTVAVTATTLRDGAFTEIPVADLVPGDVVRLGAGDVVPADGRLISANNLQIDQAILTGESFPADKQAGDLAAPVEEVGAAVNAAFAGSSVVGGSGVLLICATGRASRLGEIAGALGGRTPPTAFQQGLNRFSALLLRIALVLVVIVLAESLALHRPWLEAVLFALALAVGLTPELLPMIVTVTLARGAVRLGGKRVIVKQLASIHNLGAMDVLCTDKTGTLTEARISVVGHPDAAGADSPRVLEFGLVNSRFQTGLKSPLDSAIAAHADLDLSAWRRIAEAPFDFRRRRVSVLAERDGQRLLIVKGAPEDVLLRCQAVHSANGAALGPDGRAGLISAFEAMGREGERVLAIASRAMPSDQTTISPDDEAGLTFEGFIAFLDPPKVSAAAALAALDARGVRINILTGDNREVALHLCRAIGFTIQGVLDGAELDALTEEALTRRLADVNLYCRVNPAQKLRILNAQKRAGRTVGFLGDGVNDAPALHAADVGLSVDSAADVAKAAAPIVLLDKDLGVLAEGVLEGRRTVRNVDKYVLMAGSANFGNICSMVLAGVFLPFLPLLPIQVLLTNLLYDVAQMGLPLDAVDDEAIRAPVHWDIRLVERFMLVMGPISTLFDLLTFFVLLTIFHAGVAFFRSGWFVESLVTQVLMIFTVRTRRALFASRPHGLVTGLAIGVSLLTLALPLTPLGALFRMTAPPVAFYGFLVLAVPAFLMTMEAAKRVFFARVSPDRRR
jgi:Mg2+-importing ATPase